MDFIYAPARVHITLPNLRWFGFRGVSAYLKAVVCWITIPLLKNLEIQFFQQPRFPSPTVYEHNRELQVRRCRDVRIPSEATLRTRRVARQSARDHVIC